MSSRLSRLLRDPVGVIKRKVIRSNKGKAYDPDMYWESRHSRFGFDIRGVGDVTFSVEENLRHYEDARRILMDVWARERVDCSAVSLLDIGCGQGFYAQAYADQNGSNYTGIDITDVLFPQLKERFPNFMFLKKDVSTWDLDGLYDVVIMIDVTQHIVDENRFKKAMENVRNRLIPGGLFIVTSYDYSERTIIADHVMARPVSDYAETFPGYTISDTIPFRDKFLFTLRSPS